MSVFAVVPPHLQFCCVLFVAAAVVDVCHMLLSHHPQLCTKVVDSACVAAADIATCIKQEQDEYYYTTHPRPNQTQGLSTAAKAGMAVGLAAAVCMLLAAAALLVVRHKRRKALLEQQPRPPPLLPTSAAGKVAAHTFDSHSSGNGGSTSQSRDGSMDSSSDMCSVRTVAAAPGFKPRSAGLPTIIRGTLPEDQAADIHLGEERLRVVSCLSLVLCPSSFCVKRMHMHMHTPHTQHTTCSCQALHQELLFLIRLHPKFKTAIKACGC